MLTISDEQRRARLASRHGLVTPLATVEAVANEVVVLHATDPASIFLSAHARMADVSVADVEAALYVDRSVFRTLAMRRTLFVASREHLPLIEVSSSADIAAVERRKLENALAASGIPEPHAWLELAFTETLVALDGPVGRPAREITGLAPRLATRITIGSGRYAQETGATSRVLGLMAVEGLLARGRPAGPWTSRQYRWHRRDQWLPLDGRRPTNDDTASELVRRWLRAFGPGTMKDLTWWTGWTKSKVTKALESLDVVEVRLGRGEHGLVLGDDIEEIDPPDPWIALLPSLDPTPMGWKEREWYVGSYAPSLFDRNGNIGPTIWADGRIVGVWTSRDDGEIVAGLLEEVSDDHAAMIDVELDRIRSFVGDVIVKPSFPTPMQKRLSRM